MVLKSIDQLILEMEKGNENIPLEKQHIITKYLLVGYDIEGRNYRDDLMIRDTDISEKDDAKTRITAQLNREVRNGRMTREEAFGIKNRLGIYVGGHLNRKMSNSTRNLIREKLVREFGAILMSHSLYLIPLQMVRDRNNPNQLMDITEAERFLEAWGLEKGVSIHTYANQLLTDRDIQNVSKAYYKALEDRFTEMDESLDQSLRMIEELQDQVTDDPTKTIRGIHRIVEAIEARTTEAQELVNRYGEPERDQLRLNKIGATTRGIRDIFEHIKTIKEDRK